MRHLILSLLLLATSAAGRAADTKNDAELAGAAAITFANTYGKFVNGSTGGYDASVKWVKKSPLCTPEFAKNLENLYAKAKKEDPQMGYGADAVISSNGGAPNFYSLRTVNVNRNTARAVVVGDKSFPMVINVLLVKQDGKWLVDASGDLAKK